MTKAILRHKAREWAMQSLYQREVMGKSECDWKLFWQQLYSSDDLMEFEQARIWAEEYEGKVTENIDTIDKTIIENVENWSFDRVSLVDLTILRLASYELLFCDVPRQVVISEAIKLAKKFGEKKSIFFINGVIDAIL